MTGYSKTPLFKKLGYKENFKAYLINPPDNYFDLINGYPENVQFYQSAEEKSMDLVHLFIRDVEELKIHLAFAKSLLSITGMLWVSWPKQSSGIKTDLNGNYVRHSGLAEKLVDIKVCAVDDTWSGLKFVYRKADR